MKRVARMPKQNQSLKRRCLGKGLKEIAKIVTKNRKRKQLKKRKKSRARLLRTKSRNQRRSQIQKKSLKKRRRCRTRKMKGPKVIHPPRKSNNRNKKQKTKLANTRTGRRDRLIQQLRGSFMMQCTRKETSTMILRIRKTLTSKNCKIPRTKNRTWSNPSLINRVLTM